MTSSHIQMCTNSEPPSLSILELEHLSFKQIVTISFGYLAEIYRNSVITFCKNTDRPQYCDRFVLGIPKYWSRFLVNIRKALSVVMTSAKTSHCQFECILWHSYYQRSDGWQVKKPVIFEGMHTTQPYLYFTRPRYPNSRFLRNKVHFSHVDLLRSLMVFTYNPRFEN